MTTYSFDRLHQFALNLFIKIGCSREQAIEAANVLLSADLRGVDSHGVARLMGYLQLFEKKRINTKPQLSVVHETPSTAVVDGDAGIGLVSGPYAMRLAIEKAKKVGTGWVAVKNSNHYGIAGYHAMMALKADCIGISMTNASPLVAPTFAKERLLGTNPISMAIPAGKEPPFVADMATTTVANGKLEILQRKNESAPLGWLQDKEGHPTQAAQGIVEGGALLPLGGDKDHGSHKGFILGSVVDILSGVLSGANYGPWVPPFVSFLDPDPNPVGEGVGHFFGAFRIDAFRPESEFKKHMDIWIQRFKNAKPINETNKVIIPGDPERKMENMRRRKGIPLLDNVLKDLQSLSKQYQVKF